MYDRIPMEFIKLCFESHKILVWLEILIWKIIKLEFLKKSLIEDIYCLSSIRW